jgi:lysophospholipid hydrolase
VKTLQDAKVARDCLYMAMPVQAVSVIFKTVSNLCSSSFVKYGTMQFGKFEEIQKKGYQAALKCLQQWSQEGRLPSAYIDGKDNASAGRKKGRSVRRNSI